MASLFAPFRGTYRYLQRQAHEQPTIFFSVLLGLAGPVMLITVPPIRKRLGYKAIEHPPTTYPSAFRQFYMPYFAKYAAPSVPNRARVPIMGYEDE
ncbi:hypothetical protein EIP86_002607 [Pleurotus ostreatoroseus]|nr:hypothetical protein EIP86_002607 [Pleurotus ostreatoroseus]